MAEIGKELIIVGAVGVGAYLLYEYLVSSCKTTPSGSFCSLVAPGTTSSTSGTGTNTGTTSSSTIQLPTAAQLQTTGNTTMSSADGWNAVFTQLFGMPIDQFYGFSFDKVYGPSPRGNISAQAFLQLPLTFGATPAKQSLTGLGAFVNYQGPIPFSRANMLFGSHHPIPYGVTYTMRGLGAFTSPSGFEKALFAGRPLRTSRVFGRQVMR